MNLSAKTEYACVAILELAANYGSGEPVQVRRIADKHGIPPQFLVQILLQLKGGGLVTSSRGASGGYQLARDPSDITLGEVVAVIEGPAAEPRTNLTKETRAARVLLDVWRDVAAAQEELLSATTVESILERARGRTEDMYYI